jgi:hypothetical protein
MERAKYQEASCAMREDGQILLHQYKCSHSGIIDMGATHLVVYSQYVGISRTVRVAIYSTAFSVSSLNSNAASEVWTGCYFYLTRMRQTLCCTC